MKARTLIAITILALGHQARAATDDEVRGGWIADVNGQRRIYILKVRNSQISGLYCWDCSNFGNVFFLQDGKVETGSISFRVFHDIGPGAPYFDTVRGTLANGRLTLISRREGATKAPPTEMTMTREPRRPASAGQLPPEQIAASATAGGPSAGFVPPPPQPPAAVPPAPAAPGPGRPGRAAYVPPGPNEMLTPASIIGTWLALPGPGKQYFSFRQVGNEILGRVCGPCDNPYTFGRLDNVSIMGDTLRFNIVHEDWGRGPKPFNNQATATLSKNELLMHTQQDNLPPPPPQPAARGGMILLGPLSIDATR
jgi:hypothetical protein